MCVFARLSGVSSGFRASEPAVALHPRQCPYQVRSNQQKPVNRQQNNSGSLMTLKQRIPEDNGSMFYMYMSLLLNFSPCGRCRLGVGSQRVLVGVFVLVVWQFSAPRIVNLL